MSFGFGVGDFVQLGQLAWTVYKACKEAPESFGNISQEVLSLHAVLREFDESFTGHELTPSREAGLKCIVNGCHKVLTDLETLVNKYESLGTQSKRTWDRMGWGFQDVTELRTRLTSNTVLLTAFMSTTQITVEKRLNKLLKEFKEGKHDGSVVTNQTVESLTADEKQTWRLIRKELEGIGITIAAFYANKAFILQWFQAAMQAGAFDEQSSN
ncbi:hypothetical protein MMC26_007560 [Xylographa opegraphella]|nr:hypothetical protein [Xylographa opegraphella]